MNAQHPRLDPGISLLAASLLMALLVVLLPRCTPAPPQPSDCGAENAACCSAATCGAGLVCVGNVCRQSGGEDACCSPDSGPATNEDAGSSGADDAGSNAGGDAGSDAGLGMGDGGPASNADAGGDAGAAAATDGGPAAPGDAGIADAGALAPIGAACPDATQAQAAGECAAGLKCYAVSANNLCSEGCTSDAQCGNTGTSANPCYLGACFAGCDPTAASPCGRSDFVCLPLSATQNICIPDCTQQAASYCEDLYGYPFVVCDSTADGDHGACFAAGGACGGAVPCATGQECYAIPMSNPATSVCVADCDVTPTIACTTGSQCPTGNCAGGLCATCPSGFECDATVTHTCVIVPAPYYGTCTLQAQCPAGEDCVGFGAAGSVCLATCTTDATCAALTPSSKCDLPLESQVNVCAETCTSTTHCPTGTTCQTFQTGLSVCAP